MYLIYIVISPVKRESGCWYRPEIAPLWVLVLFRAGTMSLQSGFKTLFRNRTVRSSTFARYF